MHAYLFQYHGNWDIRHTAALIPLTFLHLAWSMHDFVYDIEPVHLLPDVKCQCNSYIVVYLKSINNNNNSADNF